MADMPRTKFNSPWTVAVIEAALNDVSSAKGSSESLTAALNAMRAEIDSLSGGVHLKGAVDYYNNLPATPSEGDAYTVRYQGTSGTDPLGIEYAWATYQGTPQWIPIGVDPSVFAKQTEMDVVANAGAKNLIPVNNLTTGEDSYCSWTVNADNSITVTPKSTSLSGDWTRFVVNNFVLPAGTYIMSGGIAESSTSNKCDTYIADIDASPAVTIARGWNDGYQTFTLTQPTHIRFGIRVKASYNSTTPVTFKPMVRSAAITDPTFQPYARTNRDLTVLTDEDRASLVELVDGGAKNLLKLGFTTKTAGEQTASMTADGNGITVNGDRNSSSPVILVYDLMTDKSTTSDTRYTIDVGKYVILPTGNPTLTLQVYCHDGAGNVQRLGDNAFTDAAVFEYTAALKALYPYIDFRLWAAKISSYDNFTFYPMICSKASWKISTQYQPYRPSWQEMWDAIQALQNGGNRALTMQMQPTESTEPEEQEER